MTHEAPPSEKPCPACGQDCDFWKGRQSAKRVSDLRDAVKERDALRAELEVAKAFHDVAVKERDAERVINAKLREEIDGCHEAIENVELRAEVERLKRDYLALLHDTGRCEGAGQCSDCDRLTGGCKRCGKPLAYPGAIYCGATCDTPIVVKTLGEWLRMRIELLEDFRRARHHRTGPPSEDEKKMRDLYPQGRIEDLAAQSRRVFKKVIGPTEPK